MRFIIAKPEDKMSMGDLFYSVPAKEEKVKAFDELVQICLRRADREFPRRPDHPERNGMIPQVEKELGMIQDCGYAIDFLVMHEIALLSRELGYPTAMFGMEGGLIISYLLGISNIHPAQTGYSTTTSDIAIETAWSDCSFDFTMAIAEPIRKQIHHRLDQRFGMVDDRMVSYSRIRLPQFHTLETIGELAAESGVSFADVDIDNPKLIESVYNDICNLKFPRKQCCSLPESTLELARIYAYACCGSEPKNDYSAVKDFVFRDDIYKELVNDADLPIGEINGLSYNCSMGCKKAKDIKILIGYGVGERMISAYRKLHNQWYAAECLARVNMLLLIKYYSTDKNMGNCEEIKRIVLT